jgi:hypothetical protein
VRPVSAPSTSFLTTRHVGIAAATASTTITTSSLSLAKKGEYGDFPPEEGFPEGADAESYKGDIDWDSAWKEVMGKQGIPEEGFLDGPDAEYTGDSDWDGEWKKVVSKQGDFHDGRQIETLDPDAELKEAIGQFMKEIETLHTKLDTNLKISLMSLIVACTVLSTMVGASAFMDVVKMLKDLFPK